MENVNNVLKDESNNDKQLIKDVSVYVKNHKDKNLPINKKFVKDILDIIFKNSEIDFEAINFIDVEDSIAYWDSEDTSVNFNITSMLNVAKIYRDELRSNVGDNRIFTYFSTLFVIFHELTHARQYYVMKNVGSNIYDSCFNFIEEMYYTYQCYHDETLIERYANLRGATLGYEVLSYVYPDKQIKDIRYFIYDHLMCGYNIVCDDDYVAFTRTSKFSDDVEVVSALETYNEIMEACEYPKVNIDASNDMSLYERLYLGLPISIDEYRDLVFLQDDMQDDNEVEDVKVLINRL